MAVESPGEHAWNWRQYRCGSRAAMSLVHHLSRDVRIAGEEALDLRAALWRELPAA